LISGPVSPRVSPLGTGAPLEFELRERNGFTPGTSQGRTQTGTFLAAAPQGTQIISWTKKPRKAKPPAHGVGKGFGHHANRTYAPGDTGAQHDLLYKGKDETHGGVNQHIYDRPAVVNVPTHDVHNAGPHAPKRRSKRTRRF